MMARLFLGLQALLFISYGIYCLVNPQAMAAGAGLSTTSITGVIELQTMYGGLQVAVGAMCLLGLLRKQYEAVALHALLFIFAGLAVVRVSLGLIHGDLSGYTLFAMLYEAACLAFLCWHLLLRRVASPVAA